VYPSGVQLVIQTLKYYRYIKIRSSEATVNAPWYISNIVLHAGLEVPTTREEITQFSVKYRDKITTHPNELASTLLEEEEPRRPKRLKQTD
jgi:hypothetical protein